MRLMKGAAFLDAPGINPVSLCEAPAPLLARRERHARHPWEIRADATRKLGRGLALAGQSPTCRQRGGLLHSHPGRGRGQGLGAPWASGTGLSQAQGSAEGLRPAPPAGLLPGALPSVGVNAN